MIKGLENFFFLIKKFVLFVSIRSVGKKIKVFNKDYEILEIMYEVFEREKIDIVFFSVGGSVSEEFVISVLKMVLVVDNMSFFRLNKDVFLVVFEINVKEIFNVFLNIIVNFNCFII